MADSTILPEDSVPATMRAATPPAWRATLPSAGFYLAWIGLAALSHLAGHTTIAPLAAWLLVAGIILTNLPLTLGHVPTTQLPAESATAQAGLAITWTTVYALLAEGPGELIPGMYLTAVLLAFTRIDATRLRQLGLAAGASFALAVVIQLLAGGATHTLWGQLLQGAGMIGMLALLGWRARQSEIVRQGLFEQTGKLQQEVLRLGRSAERDHLTKSFNRQYIMDMLVREKAQSDRSGRPFSVCIFDLNRLKTSNDSHGHGVGDRILTAFANRARKALRSMDAINPTRFRRALGRLGGEEFIAVLPGTGLIGALRCAERVRETAVSRPLDQDLQLTVSAGVAEYRRGETIPELLTRADHAMFAAKRGGRNRVHVSSAAAATDSDPPKPSLRIVR